MRVVLFHSDAPDEAAAAGPLVHLLGEGGHDVLNLGGSEAMDALMDVYPGARCQRVRDGGKDATAAVRAFGPESVCVLTENDTWSLIQKSGALNGATRVDSQADRDADYRARCESVAKTLLGKDSVAKLRTAWRARGLGNQAAAARGEVEAASGQIQTLCADAVNGIVRGLERTAELKDVSRLIATLQDAIESQAADNADLQTQLEARAATIKSRDEQISLLRAQVAGMGLQLERMHRLGAELQEAHRVAGQLRERLEAIQSSDAVSIPRAELEDLKSKAAQVGRLHEIGGELQRLHGVVSETRGQVSTREAELAAARAQIEELREQVRNLHGLGAELHRVHAVAGEQKMHLEIRTARVADLQRQVDEMRTQLETARRDLRESDARGSAAGTSALIEAGRAARASEAFVGVQQALVQAQAREETFRNELARARTDRDALDALVSARDAELAQIRIALDAERRARDAALGARDQARGHAAALLRENATLRQHVRDLLASRWRKLGQKIGVAMTLPWERELREVKPGGIAPRPQEGPARAKNA